jgi:hypothetical protein
MRVLLNVLFSFQMKFKIVIFLSFPLTTTTYRLLVCNSKSTETFQSVKITLQDSVLVTYTSNIHTASSKYIISVIFCKLVKVYIE